MANVSRRRATRSQIGVFETQIEIYQKQVGRFPTQDEGLEALVYSYDAPGWNGPYLIKRSLPRDPWGDEYYYRNPGRYSEYDVFSAGPDGIADTSDDIGNWDGERLGVAPAGPPKLWSEKALVRWLHGLVDDVNPLFIWMWLTVLGFLAAAFALERWKVIQRSRCGIDSLEE